MKPNLPNYVKDDSNLDNVDMAGLIFQPYDDGQYAVVSKFYRGFNVPGMYLQDMDFATARTYSMQSAGDMDGAAISFKVDGVGMQAIIRYA